MSKFPSSAKIGLTDRLSEHIAGLYMSQEYSDVSFYVENETLPVHKVVITSYEYFRALLCGGLAESVQNVVKLNVGIVPMKAILKYIYFGYISLADLSCEAIFEILVLADMFLITVLTDSIMEYLKHFLTPANVLDILELSRSHRFEPLMEACFVFVDSCATNVLWQAGFQKLSQESLCDLLKRDTFFASEIDIFVAVQNWHREHAEADIDLVMSLVRLPLLDVNQLLTVVKPSGIVPSNRLLDFIENQRSVEQNLEQNIKRQKELATATNLASLELGSKVIYGVIPHVLLNDKTLGFTSHIIQETGMDEGIVVDLGSASVINFITFLLSGRCYAYEYVIEVSRNNIFWERVVDHSKSSCRAMQQLYFPARKVRFIRLLGVSSCQYEVKSWENCSSKMIFAVRQLRAMHITVLSRIRDGIIVPSINVANASDALVVVGENSWDLLNGNMQPTIGNIDCTYHELKPGKHILIHLNQPYYIGSMRLRLWDLDNQTYRFYIEVSAKYNAEYDIIFDKRNEDARSWQTITFETRVVSFIRITGTHSSAVQEFRLVHIECPADFRVPRINRALN